MASIIAAIVGAILRELLQHFSGPTVTNVEDGVPALARIDVTPADSVAERFLRDQRRNRIREGDKVS